MHVHVLKGVLGNGAPHAGLAMFGHGVTVRDLDFGGFIVGIASGDLHHRMAHVQTIVEGHSKCDPARLVDRRRIWL